MIGMQRDRRTRSSRRTSAEVAGAGSCELSVIGIVSRGRLDSQGGRQRPRAGDQHDEQGIQRPGAGRLPPAHPAGEARGYCRHGEEKHVREVELAAACQRGGAELA
jgi:hypothetical protein